MKFNRRSLQTPKIFDPETKIRQRNLAASNLEMSKVTDYLKDEVAERLVDRLLDIKKRFPTILDYGSGSGHISKFLDDELARKIIQVDDSEKMLYRDADEQLEINTQRILSKNHLIPLENESVDAVMSSMSMHWINDLPGAFKEAFRVLKTDGTFIGALLGGESLFELRCSFQLAEMERKGGVSPHISPMAQAPDMAGLLSQAGFKLPTIDVDEIVINYPSVFELMEDLKYMGENNAVLNRKPVVSRDTLMSMASIYQQLYGNEDGTVPATFHVIYMIGWKEKRSNK